MAGNKKKVIVCALFISNILVLEHDVTSLVLIFLSKLHISLGLCFPTRHAMHALSQTLELTQGSNLPCP